MGIKYVYNISIRFRWNIDGSERRGYKFSFVRVKKVGIEELHANELDSFIGPPIQQSFIERYNMSEGEVERAVFIFVSV